MAVKFDSSRFKARMARINGELLSAAGAAGGNRSIVASATYDVAEKTRNKYRFLAKINYRWDTQVGITQNDFITATALIAELGVNHFGILNIRAMGTEKDIAKIANVPGLWHQGKRAFSSFETKVLNKPPTRIKLESLRLPYWTTLNGGHKVPQWIYLEYGDDGGGLTPPGNALLQTKSPKHIFRIWKTALRTKIRAARI